VKREREKEKERTNNKFGCRELRTFENEEKEKELIIIEGRRTVPSIFGQQSGGGRRGSPLQNGR
jgi:glutaredoxin